MSFALRATCFIALFTAAACSPTPVTMDAGLDALDAMDDTPAIDAGSDDVPPVPVSAMTTRGPVVGRARGGISAFLGIPYAAPPIGPRRWREPIEHEPWTAPIEVATPMIACPQRALGPGGVPPAQDENCLLLSVWTPNPAPAMAMPMMLFIHGGGFTGGRGGDPMFDGALLAARGQVVVSINYRLGQLGFLGHPALTAEDTAHHSSSNYGLLDQQAALRWVQANAAAFGGDPRNVTLFGESAGAISICAQLVSPLSAGLFQRAILESGTCSFLFTPLRDSTPPSAYQSAESLGLRFATALGCDTAPDVLACLRAATAQRVIETEVRVLEDLRSFDAHYQPAMDGYVFAEPPWRALRAGHTHRASVIVGVNRDEGSGFSIFVQLHDQAEYEAAIRNLTPDHVADVNALYPVTNYASFNQAFAAFLNDAVFTCPARMAAAPLAGVDPRTYLYQFTRVNNIGRSLNLGAFHGSELPYVFGNFVSPFTSSNLDRMVSAQIQGYWTRFAATGDPNGGGEPVWPAYTAAGDGYLELGDTAMPRTGLHRDACRMIEVWLDAR